MASLLQGFIERNAQISFQTALTAETNEYFKGLERSTLQLTANLTADEQRVVNASFTCPVRYVHPKHPEVRPHPVLATIRDGMRKILYGLLKRTDELQTLYVGAAFREIKNGMFHANTHFSIYGTEPKDDNRVYVEMLNELQRMMRSAQKADPAFAKEEISISMAGKDLADLYCHASGLTTRVGWKLEEGGHKFQRLIYEDSHYNHEASDFYRDFKNTGANIAYVVGLLPVELLEEKGPINELYTIQRVGSKVRMTDKRGFSNGYMHEYSAWSTLLNGPAYQGAEFNLVFEIVARAGPFAIVEICRTANGGPVTRDLTLYKEPYVKIVNLASYFDKRETAADLLLQEKVDMDSQFVMSAEEYAAVHGYVSSLDDKSISLPVVTSFIRRRSGGAALIDKVFTKAWELEEEHYTYLAAAVMIKVGIERTVLQDAQSRIREDNVFWRSIRSCLEFSIPAWVFDLFWRPELRSKIVTRFDPVKEQTVELRAHTKETVFTLQSSKQQPISLEPVEKSKCELCSMMPWLAEDSKDDEQVMKCGKDIQLVKLGLSQERLDKFAESILANDEDSEELQRLCRKAKAELPKAEFSIETKVATIVGGFGTGKSHQIRKMVTSADVVIAPFRKLMSDYEKDSDGEKIFFKTNHRAIIDHRSCRYMFIDECGSMPAEYIEVIAYLYQPEIIFLVGDMKQTKTTAAEGTCIDQRVNFRGSHYLWKNFRNPVETISWACEKYGYDMIPAGERYNSKAPMVTYVKEDWAVPDGMAHISADRAHVNLGITSHTVRQYQGQTEPELAVTLSPASLGTFSVACIKLVALTRAKGTTYLRLTEGISKEAVKGAIAIREYTVFKQRAQNEPKSVKDSRFIEAILAHMKESEARAIYLRLGLEATALDWMHQEDPPVSHDVKAAIAARRAAAPKKPHNKVISAPKNPRKVSENIQKVDLAPKAKKRPAVKKEDIVVVKPKPISKCTPREKALVKDYFRCVETGHEPSPELVKVAARLSVFEVAKGKTVVVSRWQQWYNASLVRDKVTHEAATAEEILRKNRTVTVDVDPRLVAAIAVEPFIPTLPTSLPAVPFSSQEFEDMRRQAATVRAVSPQFSSYAELDDDDDDGPPPTSNFVSSGAFSV